MSVLRSRDNPRVKRWSKLVQDSKFRRQERRALIEGPHLLGAFLERGLKPLAVLATESGLARDEIASLVRRAGVEPVVLSEPLFRRIADAETPPGVAAEIAIPHIEPASSVQSVFLEGVQDPANVGAIIRSAAAFAAGLVVLDGACADPWSPKALRAGMGGHFCIALKQVHDLRTELEAYEGKLVSTVPRNGVPLRGADLGARPGWIFGAEGQGVSDATARLASVNVTIAMAPAMESLNVAATAAICLYQAFNRPAAGS